MMNRLTLLKSGIATSVAALLSSPTAAASVCFKPSRNVGQAELDFTLDVDASNGGAPLRASLAFNAGDDSLVDLSDPTYPTIITPGLYAVSATIHNAGPVAGGVSRIWRAALRLDDNWYSISASAGPNFTNATMNPAINEILTPPTWWCDADDPIFVTIASAAAEGDPDHFVGRVFVQRLT